MKLAALAVAVVLATLPAAGPAAAPPGMPAVVDLAREQAAVRFVGAGPGDGLGSGGFAVGDFDGDGASDLAIGSPEAAGGRGTVSVMRGPTALSSRDFGVSPPDLTIVGAFAGSGLGRAVAAGDLDADGKAELVVSTTTYDARFGRLASGGALIFSGVSLGGTGRVDLSEARADACVADASVVEPAGAALATGDFDADGYADLAAGSPLAPGLNGASRAGRVAILFGGPAPVDGVVEFGDGRLALVGGLAADDGLGAALAAGDVSGGRGDDLIAGTPNRDGSRTGRQDKSGEVFVISGGSLAPGARLDLAANTAALRLLARDEGDYLGLRVATADVDGDRVADVVTSAIDGDGPLNGRYPDCGEVYVFAGDRSRPAGSLLDVFADHQALTILGDAPSRFLGFGLATGDLDADRSAEVCAASTSAPGPNGVAGAVFVVRWRPGTFDLQSRAADTVVYGAAAGDALGRALGVADLDGDGARECLISAPGALGGRGVVYVVRGVRSAENAAPEIRPVETVRARPGHEVTVELAATDPDGDPIAFSLAGRPPGSVFEDRGDGTATLRYTSSAGAGPFHVLVSARDGLVEATTGFSIDVAEEPAAAVTAAAYKRGALRLTGDGFAAGASVIINDAAAARPAAFKPASGKLVVKGTRAGLGLSAAPGANTVRVVMDGVASAPFAF